MNKILQIIRREYITRVRKRSFILMTFLGPVLFAAFMIAPYKLATLEDNETKTIAVVELDSNGQPTRFEDQIFRDKIERRENLKFVYLINTDSSQITTLLDHGNYEGILLLRQNIVLEQEATVGYYSKKQPSAGIEGHIEQSIENFLYDQNLIRANLSPEVIESLKSNVRLITQKYDDGEIRAQDRIDQKRGIGYAAGFLIYMFIFFFGAQVMRGVIEEKTNRIIEVIITSVRPFQLMMGKIGGIALLALTQFVMWIILTLTIYQYGLVLIMGDEIQAVAQQEMVASGNTLQDNPEQGSAATPFNAGILGGVTMGSMVSFFFIFLFYFLFGYLLYASLFAAVGSAVDAEADTQQFMLPVTIPLILGIVIMINAITNPEGQLVFWFSMIPLTSPIVMMARLPFNPPTEELLISMVILAGSFVFFTWLAGKIYRTGILMYGKKPSWKEIFRWVRYRD